VPYHQIVGNIEDDVPHAVLEYLESCLSIGSASLSQKGRERMGTTSEIRDDLIYCTLTDRRVTISTELVSLYSGESSYPMDVREAGSVCRNLDASCPKDCMYNAAPLIGYGRDPRNGEGVVVNR
jgi:hypothetical protein